VSFNSTKRFFARKNIRRAALVTMPLVALTMIAPFAMADGDGWRSSRDHGRQRDDGRRDSDRRGNGTSIVIRPEIIIGQRPREREVVVVERRIPARRVEVLPQNLTFKAYQSQDRVIVNIEGMNRGEGFTTELAACHGDAIDLTNLAPFEDCGTGRIVPFCLTGSISARRAMHSVTVNVAGRTFTVPVTQAISLS
jgi:hypothetical protein